MKRSKVSRRKSSRVFKSTASRPHPVNTKVVMRGGIRL